jgi:virulence-associated protein VapD
MNKYKLINRVIRPYRFKVIQIKIYTNKAIITKLKIHFIVHQIKNQIMKNCKKCHHSLKILKLLFLTQNRTRAVIKPPLEKILQVNLKLKIKQRGRQI